MSVNTPDIPSLSTQVSSEVRRAFAALRDWLSAVRKDGGVVTEGGIADAIGGSLPAGLMDTSVPLRITGLAAVGAFRTIVLTWDVVSTSYRSFGYVEVWRNTINDIGSAIKVGTTSANVYSDAPPEASLAATYYYWVRAVNRAGIVGPFNSDNGTSASTANDPGYILELLAGQVSDTELHASLQNRISSIESNAAVAIANIGSITTTDFSSSSIYAVGALVKYQGEVYQCVTDINSLPSPLPTNNTYWKKIGEYASLSDMVSANAAGISSLDVRADTVEGVVSSHAEIITGLESTVNDDETGLSATRALLVNEYATTASLNTALSSATNTLVASINKTYRQATAPTNPINGRNLVDGDLWYDSDDNNHEYRWSGTSWVDNRDGVVVGNAALIQTEAAVRATTTGPNWSSGSSYAIGTVVVYASALYQCVVAHVSAAGNAPPSATYWKSVTVSMYSQYTVKTGVGGKVAGFGLANDGVTSSFEIIADRFAICNINGADTKYPFVVDSVYGVIMDNALIKGLTAENIAAKSIGADKISVSELSSVSSNLGSITAGSINIGNGKFIVNSDGAVAINSAMTGGRLLILSNCIKVYDENNVLRVKLGDLSA